LLGIADISVPWKTLLLSVGLYVVVPLAAGLVTRQRLVRRRGEPAVAAFKARAKPWSIVGLLLTVVLLLGFQGRVLLEQPLVIAMIAMPLLIQSYGIFALAYGWVRAWASPSR